MNENWFNAPVTDAERRENFPLTATVEGSAEQDSRVQTEGVRYVFDQQLGQIDLLHPVRAKYDVIDLIGWSQVSADVTELVRRANAYTEAVELLRRLLSTSPLMNHGAKLDAAAFLAKQP